VPACWKVLGLSTAQSQRRDHSFVRSVNAAMLPAADIRVYLSTGSLTAMRSVAKLLWTVLFYIELKKPTQGYGPFSISWQAKHFYFVEYAINDRYLMN